MKSLFCKIATAAALVVAVLAVLTFVAPPPDADAQGGYPLGADIITSATGTNRTCTLTSTTNATVTVTSNLTIAANVQRVRLTITGDAALPATINYGSLTGTQGFPLAAAATWTSQRPALVKDAVTISVPFTFTTNGTTNVVFKVIEETGSY